MAKTAATATRAPGSSRRRRPRRLLLFVHYNKWGELADYVVYLLKRVRKVYARIVFISNSPLDKEALENLAPLCNEVVQRENTGFDFYAWKLALEREGPQGLAAYDSVTLMNDTCFGPLFDLEAVYREMEARGTDFWGLTNHRKKMGNDDLATDGCIPEHIQSYFLCFKKEIVTSEAFVAFWKNVEAEEDLIDCIRKYETQLAGYLRRHGFSSTVLCNDDSECFNPTIENPSFLLRQKSPFIKIKTFFTHSPPESRYLFSLVRKHSRYPVSLIRDHIRRLVPPGTSVHIVPQDLEKKKRPTGDFPAPKIGVHVHAFYPDILGHLLTRISEHIPVPADIFLTTDTEDKAAEIKKMLSQDFPQMKVSKLLVCENRGRDVWPWLQLAPVLSTYDLVGHFHTKKSPTVNALFSELWLEELLESLIDRFAHIYTAFARQPRLGIVIPDIPSGFSHRPYKYDEDREMKFLLPKVWERIGCTRPVDFSKVSMLVFSYGNMFWYRPAALAPLWQTPWRREDIPKEPVPTDGTLLHALERLPAYVAWDQGYDYRIARQPGTRSSGFQNELASSISRRRVPRSVVVDAGASTLQLLHAKMRRRFSKK